MHDLDYRIEKKIEIMQTNYLNNRQTRFIIK